VSLFFHSHLCLRVCHLMLSHAHSPLTWVILCPGTRLPALILSSLSLPPPLKSGRGRLAQLDPLRYPVDGPLRDGLQLLPSRCARLRRRAVRRRRPVLEHLRRRLALRIQPGPERRRRRTAIGCARGNAVADVAARFFELLPQ